MSHLDELSERVAAGETINFEREAQLAALDFARHDEQFANEMVEIMRLLDEAHVNSQNA